MTLPVAGVEASQFVARQLGNHGIELLSGHKVTGVDQGALSFEDGSMFRYDVLLGVPAASPPPVIKQSPLAGSNGWIEPDRHALRTAFERVYAVGDCTLVPTANAQLPKAGVFAAAQAEVAATNIAADLGTGDGATFDGHGFCFLELPGRRVAYVEGNFFAEPAPDVKAERGRREPLRPQAGLRARPHRRLARLTAAKTASPVDVLRDRNAEHGAAHNVTAGAGDNPRAIAG